MKTKLRMLKNAAGCEDGFTVKQYCAGEVYELENDLAECFLKSKQARLYDVKEDSREVIDIDNHKPKEIKVKKEEKGKSGIFSKLGKIQKNAKK